MGTVIILIRTPFLPVIPSSYGTFIHTNAERMSGIPGLERTIQVWYFICQREGNNW
jgi:hypothetical protein